MTYCRKRSSSRYGIGLFLLMICFLFAGFGEKKDMLPIYEEDISVLRTSSESVTGSVSISLYRTDLGELQDVSLEDYIVGVVAAEMPQDFEIEALKAQAIIARTYTLWKAEQTDSLSNHGDLCDDPGHCQAYLSPEELRERWGSRYEENYHRVCNAVFDTEGQVLLFEDELAQTFYHSACGGKTASAAEVWGEDIPYLQSVACHWDRDAPRYCETVSVSLNELPWLLGDGASPCISVARGEDISHIPSAVAETDSGRVQEVSYAGLIFDAMDFREALGLNSTCFTMAAEGDTLHITTYGYGHGVGLCQHGANGLAREGKTCEEILSHYYRGVTLEK